MSDCAHCALRRGGGPGEFFAMTRRRKKPVIELLRSSAHPATSEQLEWATRAGDDYRRAWLTSPDRRSAEMLVFYLLSSAIAHGRGLEFAQPIARMLGYRYEPRRGDVGPSLVRDAGQDDLTLDAIRQQVSIDELLDAAGFEPN